MKPVAAFWLLLACTNPLPASAPGPVSEVIFWPRDAAPGSPLMSPIGPNPGVYGDGAAPLRSTDGIELVLDDGGADGEVGLGSVSYTHRTLPTNRER